MKVEPSTHDPLAQNDAQLEKIRGARRVRRRLLIVLFCVWPACLLVFLLTVPTDVHGTVHLEQYPVPLSALCLMFASLLALFLVAFWDFATRSILRVRLKHTGIPMIGIVLNDHTFGEYENRIPVVRVTAQLETGELTQAEVVGRRFFIGQSIPLLVDPRNHARAILRQTRRELPADY
jgi:hypothetical protein